MMSTSRRNRTPVVFVLLLVCSIFFVFAQAVQGAVEGDTKGTEPSASLLPPIKSPDIAGYHGTSLTHLFIPFMESQLDQVKDVVQKWWSAYPPCLGDDFPKLAKWRARSSGNDKRNTQLPVRLALVVGRTAPENEDSMKGIELDLKLKERVSAAVKLCSSAKPCFQDEIHICIARFTPEQANNTKVTDRLFYEMMLKGQCVRGRRGYLMYMEPNTLPVQSRWLTTLAATVSFPASASWLVGPAFRGDTTKVSKSNKPGLYHMNRNQLVRVTNDPVYDEEEDASKVKLDDQPRPIGPLSFAFFYFGQVRTWLTTTKGANAVTVFDQDMSEFIMQHQHWNIARGVVAHRVQFTNLILDIPDRPWSLATVKQVYSKDVILVHSGVLEGPGPVASTCDVTSADASRFLSDNQAN